MESILIKNVHVFDGTNNTLSSNRDVLIKGNRIETVGESIPEPKKATVIDGGGRTLTPGFIDIHTHLHLNMVPGRYISAPHDYHSALALWEANNTLMRGFTTVRDVGGSVWGVKQVIDDGLFCGPRIFSSGPAITMTSGHGDFRTVNSLPRQLGGPGETEAERLGMCILADGISEVLSAARVAMRGGAAFLKMFIGGAVSGMYDPLDIAEFSLEEVKAATGEAERWNTYVSVHTYTDKSTQIAIEAGAKTLEHCNLISEETVRMAVDKNCYISPQAGVFLAPPPPGASPGQIERQHQAAEGLDNLLTLCKKHKAKIAFGCDLFGSLEDKKMQSDEFANRTQWFSNAEILTQATACNAEILALSGPRNPYPGKLGVIEEGALADILLINGDPLDDIGILSKPEESLALIMKDGKIFKNII